MPDAATIDDVIAELDRIIEWARAGPSRLGYFPALYRRVTRAVKQGIADGRFEDGPRLERLDVVFANRYLRAFEDHRACRWVSGCWRLAFEAAGRTDRIVLQHLLLGINAHINLDLGIASAEVAPGDSINGLQADFRAINQILFDQIDGVQTALGAVSPWLGLLNMVGGRDDEKLIEFSLARARDASWLQATLLARKSPDALVRAIGALDIGVTFLGRKSLDPPGFLLLTAIRLIAAREEQDIVRVIDTLQ